MKIQRKLLTEEQKNEICNKRICDNCQLAFRTHTGETLCWQRVEHLKKDIDKFWNEEVDI